MVIWLAFSPVLLTFNLGTDPHLSKLSLTARVLLSTLVLTPLMAYRLIPPSSRLLAPQLYHRPQRVTSLPEAHWRLATRPGGVGHSTRPHPADSIGYPTSTRLSSLAVEAS